METHCGLPLCCRKTSGAPKSKETTSGKWGDYQCDLNPLTLQNLVEFVSEEIKPDAVLWGGDSIPHDVAAQTFDEVIEFMTKTTSIFTEGLEWSTKIYPTIGNHDTFP